MVLSGLLQLAKHILSGNNGSIWQLQSADLVAMLLIVIESHIRATRDRLRCLSRVTTTPKVLQVSIVKWSVATRVALEGGELAVLGVLLELQKHNKSARPYVSDI